MLNDIWSKNKIMNMAINVLLVLAGVNFLHLGQLILPVICFLLFIENRFRFKVNDPLVFVILCLFAVTFYYFSYQLGFYAVMGFTCPMAYYIGSNIRSDRAEDVKKIIYLLAFAMGFHVLLNAIAEMIYHGPRGFFFSSTHYDFWTRDKISNTGTAINADLMIGAAYHAFIKERNKTLRIAFGALLAVDMFYLIVIGRRTPLLMMALIFVILFFYDASKKGNVSDKAKKMMLGVMTFCFLLVLGFVIFYHFDLFSCREFLDQFRIIMKFKQGLVSDERFRLYFGAWRQMPEHLFGGQQISAILGQQVHDLWLDIFDYAGIFPFILMVLYSLHYLKVIIRCMRSDRFDRKMKTLLLGVFLAIAIQMFLEPVMTGASLYLLMAIIIGAICERYVNER